MEEMIMFFLLGDEMEANTPSFVNLQNNPYATIKTTTCLYVYVCVCVWERESQFQVEN